MPATCSFCDREMNPDTSCVENKQIEVGDTLLDPVYVGEGSDWTEGTCHDCNAPEGGVHHPGCDTERCPNCGGQLLSCRCRDVSHVVQK